MLTFLSRLAQVLTSEGKDWRKSTVFLLDGASYHKSDETRQHILKLGIKVILSAPYSYDTAPAELLFAYFKRDQINPDHLPTGRK